VRNYKIIKA